MQPRRTSRMRLMACSSFVKELIVYGSLVLPASQLCAPTRAQVVKALPAYMPANPVQDQAAVPLCTLMCALIGAHVLAVAPARQRT